MVEELKGPGQYSQIDGLRLSFLFRQVFEGDISYAQDNIAFDDEEAAFEEAAPLPCWAE